MQEIKIPCPVCGNDEAVLFEKNLNIPYYNDFFMTSIICKKCGLRSTDFRNLHSSDHTKWIYRVTSLDDFETKIVRSSTGIVEIPEIGIKVEPQMMPETWIKNVEGLLLHFQERIAIFLQEDDAQIVQEARKRISIIENLLQGEGEFTIIVEDPEGNSLIIPYDDSKLQKKILPKNKEGI